MLPIFVEFFLQVLLNVVSHSFSLPNMNIKTCLSALLAASSFINALPAVDSHGKGDTNLRLIKTSEADPAVWVTEEDKISKYRAKKTNFIDITDIKDPETLQLLSGAGTEGSRADAAAVAYPTIVSHQTEANGLIANANTTGPQSWLKTLTEYFSPRSLIQAYAYISPASLTATIAHHMAPNPATGSSTKSKPLQQLTRS